MIGPLCLSVVSFGCSTLRKADKLPRPNVALHVAELAAKHTKLANEIRQGGTPIPRPVSLEKFAGFPRASQGSNTDLAYGDQAFATWTNISGGESAYLVAVGTQPHFFAPLGKYSTCPFHTVDGSNSVRKLFAGAATSRRRKQLFRSDDRHACSHRDIRGPRTEFCIIRDVETELCCHGCVFLDVCWKDRLAGMPCPT